MRKYLKILYLIMDLYSSTIYKECLQINNEKTTQFKNGQITWVDIPPKKIYK